MVKPSLGVQMSFDEQNYDPVLLTSAGYFKHHATLSARPNAETVELLKKNGIIYKPGRFSKEEDEIIKKNWEAYRDENDLNDDKVDLFLPRIDDNSKAEKWEFIRNTAFYPKLCKGLNHRYAQQVGLRFFKLYDPAIRKGYKEISYKPTRSTTEQEYKEKIVFLRFQKNKSMYSIAEKFRLTVTEVRNTCTKHLIEQKTIPTRMYKSLLKSMEKEAGRAVVQKIFNKCAEGNLDGALSLSYDLPFKAVEDNLKKSMECCKESWFFILKVMERLYQHFKSLGKSNEEAYTAALRCIVTKKKPRITNEQFAKFLKILLTYLDRESVYTGAFSYQFDKTELREDCIKEMLFLFQASCSEVNYMLKYVVQMLNHGREVFDRVSTVLTLYDRVTVIYEYYSNISILIDDMEPTDKLYSVYRNPLLDTLAIFLTKEAEGATVPRKWKNYMSDEHHVHCKK